jgi:hypothetical protein
MVERHGTLETSFGTEESRAAPQAAQQAATAAQAAPAGAVEKLMATKITVNSYDLRWEDAK